MAAFFPVPKALLFTDEHRRGRARELQSYLRQCVAFADAVGPSLFPPALDAFLFSPTDGSTFGSADNLPQTPDTGEPAATPATRRSDRTPKRESSVDEIYNLALSLT